MTGRFPGLGQTTLEGLVTKTTDKAVLYMPDEKDEVWIPRKVCLNGDAIEEGDTDIVVADWWLKQAGLL